MSNRRTFLASSVLLATGLGYSYQRGLRYPRLSLEPRALANQLLRPDAAVELFDAINLPDSSLSKLDQLSVRAVAPSPKVMIKLNAPSLKLSINNVLNNAELSITADPMMTIEEEVQGINRHLFISGQPGQKVQLHWHANLEQGLDFAVIGDTGGGRELDWCLARAAETEAKFLLHLGDFNYTDGEYARAITQFQQAPLPCYITIGNHDFNDSGLVYSQFLRHLGPLNNYFEITGTRFVNIDTAADFFPAQSGLRGAMLSALTQTQWQGDNTLLFTHSPLRDPRPRDDHEVGGINEVNWLSQMAKRLNAQSLLCGHVHHSAELDINGLRQWTIGEGLGHEDLIHQKPVAKMLLGRIMPGRAIDYRWVDLSMPLEYHTSPTHEFKLKRDGRTRQLDWFRSSLDQANFL